MDEGPTGIKAPDGGWGWAVLLGCFIITGFSYAFPKAVSVFFKELMYEFGIGYSDTAWISSILLAMLYGTGEGRLPGSVGLACPYSGVRTAVQSPSVGLGPPVCAGGSHGLPLLGPLGVGAARAHTPGSGCCWRLLSQRARGGSAPPLGLSPQARSAACV